MEKDNKPFVVVRDDGYSPFACYGLPYPVSDEEFLQLYVDYMTAFPDIKVKEMGCGPGYTFTYATKAGENPLFDADETALSTVRDMDIKARSVVADFISRGTDTINLVSGRCHELGIKTWIRYEINMNLGIPAADNMPYTAFAGSFLKQHPEYRIGYDPVDAPFGIGTQQDFSIEAVRDDRLKMIREFAQHEIDGVSIDFCVNPPFVSDVKTGAPILTQFIRDARRVLDEEGARRKTRIDLIARMDYDAEKYGLMWKNWVREGLLDYIIPSVARIDDCWDVPNEEFVECCKNTSCRVLTCIRPFVNTLVWTDPQPQDHKSGVTREDERMTKEQLYAKAYAGLANGADGVEIAIATGGLTDTRPINEKDEYRRDGWRDVYAKLGDIEYLKARDKEYSFNNNQGLPAHLTAEEPKLKLTMRIPDEPGDIKRAVLVLHGRGLTPYENIMLRINGHGLMLTEKELNWASYDAPILTGKELPRMLLFRIKEWWNICRNEISVPVEFLKKGINRFEFEYRVKGNVLLKNKDYAFGRVSLKLKIED